MRHPRLALALSIVLVGGCGSPLPAATTNPASTSAISTAATPVPTIPAATTAAAPTAAAAGRFSVDYPASGTTVTTSTVAVGGQAPAGGRVVRDISFGFDDEVFADATGRWEIRVELDQGANELTFRLGDDDTTSVQLTVTYASIPVATNPPDPTDPPDLPDPTDPPLAFRTFGDGTWEVGVDIKAGTYRLRDLAGFCYWARLRGFDGDLKDIIANENVVDGFGVVTIKKADVGFESKGCDEWSSDLSRVTASKSEIVWDGTYIVGTDIAAGRWRSTGGEDLCYWARLSAFTGGVGAIIANGLPDGRAIVTIRSTDKGFVTKGCGTWARQ